MAGEENGGSKGRKKGGGEGKKFGKSRLTSSNKRNWMTRGNDGRRKPEENTGVGVRKRDGWIIRPELNWPRGKCS